MIRHQKKTVPLPTAVQSAELSFSGMSTNTIDGEHNSFLEWMSTVSSVVVVRGSISHFRIGALGMVISTLSGSTGGWRKAVEATKVL